MSGRARRCSRALHGCDTPDTSQSPRRDAPRNRRRGSWIALRCPSGGRARWLARSPKGMTAHSLRSPSTDRSTRRDSRRRRRTAFEVTVECRPGVRPQVPAPSRRSPAATATGDGRPPGKPLKAELRCIRIDEAHGLAPSLGIDRDPRGERARRHQTLTLPGRAGAAIVSRARIRDRAGQSRELTAAAPAIEWLRSVAADSGDVKGVCTCERGESQRFSA
jgi:hypothetical protein